MGEPSPAPAGENGKAASGRPARGYTWPPFQDGNVAALRTGHRSDRMLHPIAMALREAALAEHPHLAAWPEAVASLYQTEATLDLLRTRTPVDKAGKVQNLKDIVVFERLAIKLRSQLGLDPLSAAEQGLLGAFKTRVELQTEAMVPWLMTVVGQMIDALPTDGAHRAALQSWTVEALQAGFVAIENETEPVIPPPPVSKMSTAPTPERPSARVWPVSAPLPAIEAPTDDDTIIDAVIVGEDEADEEERRIDSQLAQARLLRAAP